VHAEDGNAPTHDVVVVGAGIAGLVTALELLDRGAVEKAIAAARPDAIVHQATALAGVSDFKHFDRSFAQTNRLRTAGTDALVAAAREAGVRRLIAQSFAGWPYYLERTVVDAGGLALRYGAFYGSPDDALRELARRRRLPIVGDGGGIWSFVHLDDAAAATVLALEWGAAGIYNAVDDEPAPVREWLRSARGDGTGRSGPVGFRAGSPGSSGARPRSC
jgi:nucleoside-diphosphate-sugar epimerase